MSFDKQGSTKKKFKKVREGWTFSDSCIFVVWLIFFIGSTYLTITRSPYFVFSTIILELILVSGLLHFLYSKVYWEEIKE